MPIDFQALTKPTWIPIVIAGEMYEAGCVPLGPGDFAEQAGALANLIGSGVAMAIRAKLEDAKPAEDQAAEDAPKDVGEFADRVQAQLVQTLRSSGLTKAEVQALKVITVLTVRQIRPVLAELEEDGETHKVGEAEPCRFVLQESDERPELGRLWVNRIPLPSIEAIAGHGIQYAMDAARRAAGFRGQRRRAAGVDAGRDGETVREEPRGVAGAA